MARKKKRRFPFNGSNTEYIKYLENRLTAAIGSGSLPQPFQFHDTGQQSDEQISSSYVSDPKQQTPFIIWEPDEESSEPLERWKLQLKQLIKDIPVITKWAEQREKYGLNTIQDNQRVIDLLLGKPDGTKKTKIETVPFIPTSSSITTWVANSYTYACQTANLEKKSQLDLTIARFRRIIVASGCDIMWKMGVLVDDIDRIMKASVSDTGYRNLEAHRRGARWINKCIPELSTNG